MSAGRLVSLGVGRDHFSHVFVDEAGHAMETEAAVPISGEIVGYPSMKQFYLQENIENYWV